MVTRWDLGWSIFQIIHIVRPVIKPKDVCNVGHKPNVGSEEYRQRHTGNNCWSLAGDPAEFDGKFPGWYLTT